MRAGDAEALNGTWYVITLDSDTALNVGTARELVGAMLHPLNRPVVDPRLRVVTEGYGLLQPRVGVELNAANRSQFSRIFAGQGGVDPYGGACSDVYHDLFDRGTYTGKGIFDVEAFGRCLDGRFPQERILSHDLLEGAYLHAGLLGDVELTDGYPHKVNSYFARLHRWVRGDWQPAALVGPLGLQRGGGEGGQSHCPHGQVEDLRQPPAEPVSGFYPSGPAAGDVPVRPCLWDGGGPGHRLGLVRICSSPEPIWPSGAGWACVGDTTLPSLPALEA